MPVEVVNLYRYYWLKRGVLGNALCKLKYFSFEVSVIVSVLSLILIAVSRFKAVVFPLRSPLISSRQCPLLILATWIIATATNSPYLFVHALEKHEGRV